VLSISPRCGVDPTTNEALAAIGHVEAVMPDGAGDWVALSDPIETFTDRRALSYWTLVGIVDDWGRPAGNRARGEPRVSGMGRRCGPTPSCGSETRRPVRRSFCEKRAGGSTSGVTRPTVVGIERFDGEADEADRKEDHVLISWFVVDDWDIVAPPDGSHIGVRFDLRVEMPGCSTHGRRWLGGQAKACALVTRRTRSGV